MNKIILALLVALIATARFDACALTNVFTYQGNLKDYGIGPDDSGHYILKYSVVVGPLDPDNPWRTNCPNCNSVFEGTNQITLDNGLFTILIRMPNAVTIPMLGGGTNVFLEFGVKTNGAGEFMTLEPMQPLTPTPFATVAQTVSGSVPASLLTGTMPTWILSGVFSSPLMFNNPANVFVGDGSLLQNINATTLGGFGLCNLPCYWNILGNGGTDPNVNFIGTTDNAALTIRVANTPALRINRSHGPETSPNIIGGDPANSIDPTEHGSVIGGGGEAAYPNTIVGPVSVIAGGFGDHIEDQANVIGGGQGNSIDRSGGMPDPLFNVIGGGWSNTLSGAWSTIGGGGINIIRLSNQGESATIAGGYANLANGHVAAIGGGTGNTAGPAGFVGGGWGNMATGNDSVVAGGTNNTASGVGAAILGGKQNLANSTASTIGGGRENAVTGDYAAVPGGRSVKAYNYGQWAFAAGDLDYAGDAQASTYVLRRKFSGNGDLYLNGDTANAAVPVPVGSVWTLHFQISGVSVTGTNFGSYEVSGMIANLGGATTFRLMDGSGAVVGTARPIYETAGAVPWLATPYLNADGFLHVALFAGEAVKWCARIDVTEVTR